MSPSQSLRVTVHRVTKSWTLVTYAGIREHKAFLHLQKKNSTTVMNMRTDIPLHQLITEDVIPINGEKVSV